MNDELKPMAEWSDPTVQAIYEILCNESPRNPEEHWEGYCARRIVAEVRRSVPASPVPMALMSNMDWAVLRMPIDLAMNGEMAQVQFYSRVQSLLNRLEGAAPPIKAEPLSDEQIATMNREAHDQGVSGIAPSIHLARAIERAHGIGAGVEMGKEKP